MKRKVFCALCALALLACLLWVPASAEETENFVYDNAGILSEDEMLQLNEAAKAVSLRYGCGVYITLFDDMADYGYRYIEPFAEEVYAQWSLGIGEENNAIILVMSMADRDYDLCAHGDVAHTAFTDYGKEVLAGGSRDLGMPGFLDDFRRDDWFDGFYNYISQCGYMLDCAEHGTPIDIPDYPEPEPRGMTERLGMAVVPGVVIGIIIAFIYCAALKSKMKTARIARDAATYIAPRGIWMQAEDDAFTHTTVTRQRIERDSGSRGGHGGTSVNSGGFSHSSGKF